MPLFEDAAFRALQSGLDAMWLKQQVASHNIANVETPDFKAKKVEFKQVLREAADGNGPVSVSYTHLDVYKRQAFHIVHILFFHCSVFLVNYYNV